MVTSRIQTYTVAIIPAVFSGLSALISAVMTTTADGQAAVDQEKINRLLEQVVKALDSGDIAAAMEYLIETAQWLPTGEAKTHLAIAINDLLYSNDTEGARLHVQLVQSSLQNSTGGRRTTSLDATDFRITRIDPSVNLQASTSYTVTMTTNVRGLYWPWTVTPVATDSISFTTA